MSIAPSLALGLPLGLGLAGAIAATMMKRGVAQAGAAVAALAFLLYLLAAPGVTETTDLRFGFWSVPSLGVVGGLRLDGLSLVFVLLITGIGALVLLYASRYLKGDTRLPRLVTLLLIFMVAMLGAVTADDVVTLFVFWELTSLASFFLVAYDHEKPGARKAALQALLVTGGGGLALLAGLILVAMAAGTTSLSGIIAAREAVLAHPAAIPAMLLVVLGCFTKSAQFPFQFWLPNAMAAPTPVSAYLHSATMVKLGIYLLARLNPVYQHEAFWQELLTTAGLLTTAVGAIYALRESDLKRVLAWTTVTALGSLTMLIGLAPALSATAAVTFLLVHALYKAALFLVAGIVDHETGTRDAAALGGLRRAMPLTALAAVLAALSMAGLPPFVGFVAKEIIYEAKLATGGAAGLFASIGFLVNAAMVAIAGLLSWRLFFGPLRPTPATPHDPPKSMLAGPILLAGLGLLAGAAPSLVGAWLVDGAVAAMLGAPAAVPLKLWHGFTPVLALSAATIALGLLLLLAWGRLMPRLRRASAFDRFDTARLYDRALAGLVAWAEGTTRLVQHGSLRGYMQVLLLVAALGPLAVLVARGGLDLPEAAPLDFRALAFLPIALGAIAAAVARGTLAAVMATGLVGFGTALVFLTFGAPDVALTQFTVEVLLIVILATVLIRLPVRARDVRTGRQRTVDAAVAGALGLSVALVLLAVLAAPFDPRLGEWFGAESVPGGHGRNVVNVILVDFRALDTLGEIAVLAIAAFSVIALLRASGRGARVGS
ncbi:cation:proton antiporter [Falsiroseomonas bella]|uniref:Cation:proton antiporter n=1 Tax=Falsiroseomonas bella TaxID=2184016 RepID=A0A317FIW2_9PROT|nr:hydrogen gas-evolving membrane-bound hydrogenase subunit E [Falsiroseomonas bella]PWS39001.1 cation:proton antiporter [Falsiroseomonas bella]